MDIKLIAENSKIAFERGYDMALSNVTMICKSWANRAKDISTKELLEKCAEEIMNMRYRGK